MRMAANLSVAFGDDKNNWSTVCGKPLTVSLQNSLGFEKSRERLASNRPVQLSRGHVLHLANGPSCLVVDHVALVLEVTVQQLVHLSRHTVAPNISMNYFEALTI